MFTVVILILLTTARVEQFLERMCNGQDVLEFDGVNSLLTNSMRTPSPYTIIYG